MRNKKIGFLAAVFAMVLALNACQSGGGGTGEPGADGGEKIKVAMISKGFQHQFWQAVKAGAEEKSAELGVEMTFEGPASETEVETQLQMLQTAIDQSPDVIAFAALDPEACIPLYDTAQTANIPIVEFDAGCNSEYPTNISKTDSKVAGALAAEEMVQKMGETGEVGIVSHTQINSTGVERRDGFVEKMKEYPGIKIVDIQYGDGDHLKSADITKAMISAHPNLTGLYGTNEGSAIGIVNALNENKVEKGKYTVIGFDAGKAQVDAVRDGVMTGAITQDPKEIGRQTIESAVKAAKGEEVEKVIDTGSFFYNSENVDSEDMKEKLYD